MGTTVLIVTRASQTLVLKVQRGNNEHAVFAEVRSICVHGCAVCEVLLRKVV